MSHKTKSFIYNAINAHRLPLALLVYTLVRPSVIIDDKLKYLEHPIHAASVPVFPVKQVTLEAFAAHTAWVKRQKEVVVLILITMEPDLQRNLENLGAYDMLQELITLFPQQAEQELLQTMREFHACKQEG
nr:zinc finger, CCHC-type [Tanacetum cinerariifolium]